VIGLATSRPLLLVGKATILKPNGTSSRVNVGWNDGTSSRGELFNHNHAPIDRVRSRAPGSDLDPRLSARDFVVIFDNSMRWTLLLAFCGTCSATGSAGCEPQTTVPTGKSEWRRPTPVTLTFMRHHPSYATPCLIAWPTSPIHTEDSGTPSSGRRLVPMESLGGPGSGRYLHIFWERCEAISSDWIKSRPRRRGHGGSPEMDSLLLGCSCADVCGAGCCLLS